MTYTSQRMWNQTYFTKLSIIIKQWLSRMQNHFLLYFHHITICIKHFSLVKDICGTPLRLYLMTCLQAFKQTDLTRFFQPWRERPGTPSRVRTWGKRRVLRLRTSLLISWLHYFHSELGPALLSLCCWQFFTNREPWFIWKFCNVSLCFWNIFRSLSLELRTLICISFISIF